MTVQLAQQVANAFLPHPSETIGVAVSGGGDSMALLHLLHGFAMENGCQLSVATVNHQLRVEAVQEAEHVAQFCARLGVNHEILLWDDWDGQGNLQKAARDARYDLLTKWAAQHQIDTIALGHTADDQAETLLMRLARRAGVDGLSGMSPRVNRHGICWMRPLLSASRNQLRDHLRQAGIEWVDDPSNDDDNYTRIKARQILTALAPLGIDASVMADVATNMSEARKALDWQTFINAREIVTIDAGAVRIDDVKMRLLPAEIQRRLIVHSLTWISGGLYPPRRSAVAEIMNALTKGVSSTADGCQVSRIGDCIWLFRELNAVKDQQCDITGAWDRRWRLSPAGGQENSDDVVIRALGPDGISQCDEWRDYGRPHAVLLSTPSVWRGGSLVAAPLAGFGENWYANVDGGEEGFFAALLSH